MPCINDSTYSIVRQYQVEYQGIVQYYRLAYNLHHFNRLRWVMRASLIKTLVKKLKTNRREIYRRFQRRHQTEQGVYKVLEVTVDRGPDKEPLVAYFGGIPLRWNKWAVNKDTLTEPIWSGRSEVRERLLAQECELCGRKDHIEVHHIRKLADLEHGGRPDKPPWVRVMAARRRKALVVCQNCHQDIHYGRYDGPALSK